MRQVDPHRCHGSGVLVVGHVQRRDVLFQNNFSFDSERILSFRICPVQYMSGPGCEPRSAGTKGRGGGKAPEISGLAKRETAMRGCRRRGGAIGNPACRGRGGETACPHEGEPPHGGACLLPRRRAAMREWRNGAAGATVRRNEGKGEPSLAAKQWCDAAVRKAPDPGSCIGFRRGESRGLLHFRAFRRATARPHSSCRKAPWKAYPQVRCRA